MNARIGLVDSGLEREHPALAAVAIERFGCNGRAVPAVHGTAVASLLVGFSPDFHGAAPGAHLFAADAWCGDAGPGGRVEDVVRSLGWLVGERVGVINLSIVGPPNVVLEAVVRRVLVEGILVVAAAGNDGPNAPPLYPAAYDGVIAVTGVDAQRRVLLEAARGKHVRFAAPGADVLAASPRCEIRTRARHVVRGAAGRGHRSRRIWRQARRPRPPRVARARSARSRPQGA